MNKTVIVSLSGGMDSATVLAYAKRTGARVVCFGFCYGSKHNQYENQAAADIADHYGVPFTLIDLSEAFKHFESNLLKSGGEIPEGHYEEETMKQTVVPARNMIFIAILTGLAEVHKASMVLVGVHAGDHAIYPDCRPDFVKCINNTSFYATDGRVGVFAPFLKEDKAGILRFGNEHRVPYHLTRTCYKDQPVACGKCGSCQERLAAFAAIGSIDPLDYESREIMPREMGHVTPMSYRQDGVMNPSIVKDMPKGWIGPPKRLKADASGVKPFEGTIGAGQAPPESTHPGQNVGH